MTDLATDLTKAELGRLARLLTVTPGDDPGEFVLGRPDLGSYVAVPAPGALFIRALQAGESLAEATARASDAAGEDVDGADFLAGLAEAGLLNPIATDPRAADGGKGRQIRWIEGVSVESAGRLFGRVAWSLYALCAVFAIVVLAGRPDLRPTWESVWIQPDPVLSVLTLLPIQLALGAGHETWHWLAGRAIGIPAVFRISHRGIFVVFETDLSRIVTVARRRRFGPFLAGMAFDGVVLAVALAVRLLYRAELLALPASLDRLLGAVVLGQVLSIALQWFLVFARSDSYAVLANALRTHNLYRTTWLVAKRRLWPLSASEEKELTDADGRDRAVANWFAFVYVAGMLGMAWLLVTIALPAAIAMLIWIIPNLASLALTTVAFWESLAVLGYLLVQYGLPPLLSHRQRRLRKAGASR